MVTHTDISKPIDLDHIHEPDTMLRAAELYAILTEQTHGFHPDIGLAYLTTEESYARWVSLDEKVKTIGRLEKAMGEVYAESTAQDALTADGYDREASVSLTIGPEEETTFHTIKGDGRAAFLDAFHAAGRKSLELKTAYGIKQLKVAQAIDNGPGDTHIPSREV